MSISDRVAELKKKWGKPEDLADTLATRIDPPVYSHPQMVYELACDMLNVTADLEDVGKQLADRTPKIIDTVAQLDELPVGSLILELESEPEKYAFPWVKVGVEGGDPMWSAPGDPDDYPASEVTLPAYVMWTPPA